MNKYYKPRSEFQRNVMVLMTGTTLCQAIPIAISPILTRIYTPEEFGIFSIYMAIAAFMAIFATLRYEHALVLARNQTEIDNLFVGSMLINVVVTFFLFFVVLSFRDKIRLVLELDEVGYWIFLIPLSVFFIGIYNSLNYRLIWMRSYKSSASNKVVQSGTNAASSISLGLMGMTNIGLIISSIFSYLCSVVFLLNRNQKKPFKLVSIRKKRIICLLVRHRDFPFVNLPAACVNGFYNNGKLIFIALFFSSSFVGYLSLVLRVLQMPLTITSSAVSDVLYKSISDELNRKNYKLIKKRIYKLTFSLAIIGLIPFLLIFFWGEEIFGFVFGENWKIAGTYASILSIGLYFMFLASPLTKVFWALQKNKLYLYWEMIRLGLFFIPLSYLAYTNKDESYVAWSISFSLLFSYVFLVVLLIFTLRKVGYEKI